MSVELVMHLLILVLIYALLGLSLNLAMGYGGMVSVGHGAFFALGAYTSALLMKLANWPFELAFLAALLLTALIGALVGMVVLHLRAEYLILTTYAFQIVVLAVLVNWTSLTRGPLGVAGIPAPQLFNWTVSSRVEYLLFLSGLTAIVFVLLWLLTRSLFGTVLRAQREDTLFPQSLGYSVKCVRLLAFMISSGVAGVAGSCYAHYIKFIDPASFDLMLSILLLCLVMLGGLSNHWGVLIGAAILVGIPEALRGLGTDWANASVIANARSVAVGLLIVGIMMVWPRGVVGKYELRS